LSLRFIGLLLLSVIGATNNLTLAQETGPSLTPPQFIPQAAQRVNQDRVRATLQKASANAAEGPRVRRSLAELLAAKRAGDKLPESIQSAGQAGADLMDGSPALVSRNLPGATTFQSAQLQGTIPYWSDGFNYQGLTYSYRMVGTDPKLGSKTTVVPTVIIPLRFVFPDGQVFDASTDIVDGQTAIQGILNSPIFKNYNFVAGGKNIGNTQYADAFQRANFWDSVSGKAKNYHVLLGQPTVLSTQTIVVPDGMGHYETDFSTGLPYPVIDRSFFESKTTAILIAAQVAPTQLPIMVWGSVAAGNAFGWHGATSINGGPLQSYIGTSYLSQNSFNGRIPDIYSLSHEIIEWLDDPFANNYSPGWNQAFLSDSQQCDSRYSFDLLEAADPVQNLTESVVTLPGGSFSYHVTEAVFIDFFIRSNHSRSVNGQYSLFEIGDQYGLQTEPSAPCTGHVELNNEQIFNFGSSFTEAFGINNNDTIVGIYDDTAGIIHGYLVTPTTGQSIDYPGAMETRPSKINDAGLVVGYYFDAAGIPHGFSFKDGLYSPIDFPGAFDTAAYGVNRFGDIVGAYDGADFNTHGFLLHQGAFTTIDLPFKHITIATAINSATTIVGFTAQYFGFDPFQGFLLGGKRSSAITFPGSNQVEPWDLNDQAVNTGLFSNSDGYTNGFVTMGGKPYEVYASTFGLNNHGKIVGSVSYGNAVYAMVGTLPGN
jgi:hypothetical protein